MNLDKELNTALSNYFKILNGKALPGFRSNRKLLLENTAKAFRILKRCVLCERKCSVDRTKGQIGYCHLGSRMLISSYFDHHGEEFFFVPSFTVFFWSCNLSCQFCQNYTISQRMETPEEIQPEELASAIDGHPHCRNMNFVGGEPTQQLPFILETLKHVKSNLPVVWNSNFYMSEESMELLKGLVDVYLSDWKYWSNKCAMRLSNAPDYLETVRRNHLLAFKDAELVIRHLILPNHFECCTRPILEYISENFGKKVVVNLMDQYRPCYNASRFPEINRRLKPGEFTGAVHLADSLGINYIT